MCWILQPNNFYLNVDTSIYKNNMAYFWIVKLFDAAITYDTEKVYFSNSSK